MTQAEATTAAQQMFGPQGHAEIMPNWVAQRMGCAVGVIESDRFRIKGTGPTWEEAFHWAEKLDDAINQRAVWA